MRRPGDGCAKILNGDRQLIIIAFVELPVPKLGFGEPASEPPIRQKHGYKRYNYIRMLRNFQIYCTSRNFYNNESYLPTFFSSNGKLANILQAKT